MLPATASTLSGIFPSVVAEKGECYHQTLFFHKFFTLSHLEDQKTEEKGLPEATTSCANELRSVRGVPLLPNRIGPPHKGQVVFLHEKIWRTNLQTPPPSVYHLCLSCEEIAPLRITLSSGEMSLLFDNVYRRCCHMVSHEGNTLPFAIKKMSLIHDRLGIDMCSLWLTISPTMVKLGREERLLSTIPLQIFLALVLLISYQGQVGRRTSRIKICSR